MPTWNTSKPATANSVAADVADIEENFDYLEDLLTYFFKTWSTSSAAIGKNSIYYVNPSAADQGADDNARSAKDLIDGTGVDKNAILYFPHFSADGNTTTFTFGTAETAYDNHTLIFENGSIIAGAGALTIQGTAIALGDLTITGTITIDNGARLIAYGNLSGAGTLTIAAGGTLHQFGANTVTTFTMSGRCNAGAVLYQSTTPVSTSGTGEDDLMSFSLPANSLRVGQALRIHLAYESTSDGNSGYRTLQFYIGAQSITVVSLADGTAATNEYGSTIIVVPKTTSSAIVQWTNGYTGYQHSDTVSSLDFTSAQTLKFTGTCTNGSHSLNQTMVIMERM